MTCPLGMRSLAFTGKTFSATTMLAVSAQPVKGKEGVREREREQCNIWIFYRRGIGAFSKKVISTEDVLSDEGMNKESEGDSVKKETTGKDKYSLRETDKRLRRKRMAELESGSGTRKRD